MRGQQQAAASSLPRSVMRCLCFKVHGYSPCYAQQDGRTPGWTRPALPCACRACSPHRRAAARLLLACLALTLLLLLLLDTPRASGCLCLTPRLRLPLPLLDTPPSSSRPAAGCRSSSSICDLPPAKAPPSPRAAIAQDNRPGQQLAGSTHPRTSPEAATCPGTPCPRPPLTPSAAACVRRRAAHVVRRSSVRAAASVSVVSLLHPSHGAAAPLR